MKWSEFKTWQQFGIILIGIRLIVGLVDDCQDLTRSVGEELQTR